jgi:hypothetical protein
MRKEVRVVDNSLNRTDRDLLEYVLSDYRTESERDSEADIPVPDRLLPRRESQRLVRMLKLSQMVGILVWLNREGLITLGGRERLLYLQSKASFEALEAGLRFARRLSLEKKLQSDFRHQMRELNRRPQSKTFRQSEARRIGVGYRDKGMLPEVSQRARREAQKDAYLPLDSLPDLIGNSIRLFFTDCLTEDGEWVDLPMLSGAFGTRRNSMGRALLPPL